MTRKKGKKSDEEISNELLYGAMALHEHQFHESQIDENLLPSVTRGFNFRGFYRPETTRFTLVLAYAKTTQFAKHITNILNQSLANNISISGTLLAGCVCLILNPTRKSILTISALMIFLQKYQQLSPADIEKFINWINVLIQ